MFHATHCDGPQVPLYTYTAVDEGDKRLLKDCSSPVSLKLVVGAQVVLLKNLEVQNGVPLVGLSGCVCCPWPIALCFPVLPLVSSRLKVDAPQDENSKMQIK